MLAVDNINRLQCTFTSYCIYLFSVSISRSCARRKWPCRCYFRAHVSNCAIKLTVDSETVFILWFWCLLTIFWIFATATFAVLFCLQQCLIFLNWIFVLKLRFESGERRSRFFFFFLLQNASCLRFSVATCVGVALIVDVHSAFVVNKFVLQLTMSRTSKAVVGIAGALGIVSAIALGTAAYYQLTQKQKRHATRRFPMELNNLRRNPRLSSRETLEKLFQSISHSKAEVDHE